MKSGASDPFADDDGEGRKERPANDGREQPSPPADEGDRENGDDSPRAGDPEDEDRDPPDGAVDAGSLSRDELPLVLRRDRVKDERPEVHQLFVQEGTHERAVDAERELETRLGVDLSRTDAREAIYLAGMANLDEAAAVLREWGYDL